MFRRTLMNYPHTRLKKSVVATALALAMPLNASADAAYDQLKAQVETLQRQLQQVQQTLDQYQQQSASKEDVAQLEQEVRSASEWKDPDTLIHMAGYADIGYTNAESMDDSFNIGTFSPIFHFQYRDLVMLGAELEIEIEDDGSTEIALEYMSADLFLNDYITLGGGKFLSPIGQFRQNLHPSWINKLPSAPPGFGHGGAAPVSELGLYARGGFPVGGIRANYAAYVGNGPELTSETEDQVEYEIHDVEAEAFGEDSDGEKVFGGRIGVLPFAGLELGVSGATGEAAVTEIDDESGLVPAAEPGVEGRRDYDVWGADFAFQYKGLDLRGEIVNTDIGATDTGVAASPGAEWETWYTQLAYRFLPTKFEGVARYTEFDSPHASRDQEQWAVGVNWLFASNIIGKFAYEFNDGASGETSDDDRLLLQFAYGF